MIEILYYDKDIAFAIKPVGISSEGEGMPNLLKKAFAEKGIHTEVFPIHRLDTAASGVMLFSLNKNAAAKLSKEISQGGKVKKEYLAIINGKPEESSGTYEDFLFKDSKKNKSYIVKKERKGVKRASLSFDVLCSRDGFSLVKVLLHTGRTHQIRVQFAGRKMPLLGDGKYGGKGNHNIALFCYKITTPDGKKALRLPEKVYPWDMFGDILQKL